MSAIFSKNQTLAIVVAVTISTMISFLMMQNLGKETGSGSKQEIAKYIENNGDKILQSVEKFYEREKTQKFAKNKDELFEDDAPYIGKKNAKITLVEFFDYNCGYCKKAFDTVQKINKKFPDIKIILKDYPIFPGSSKIKARASMAVFLLEPKKYWEAHEILIKTKMDNVDQALEKLASLGIKKDILRKKMKSKEVKKALDRNIKLAQSLGFNGTPAFVLNEEIINGYLPFSAMAEKIQNIK